MKAYHAYNEMVRIAALAVIDLPLHATCGNPIWVRTHAHFYNGTHADPENVHKGIVDALFWSREHRGSDKHVGGRFWYPLYAKVNPRVEVEILWLTMK